MCNQLKKNTKGLLTPADVTSLLSFETTHNGENDKHKVSRPVGDPLQPLQPLVAQEKCVFPDWLQVFAVCNQVKLIAKRLLHQNLPCDFL